MHEFEHEMVTPELPAPTRTWFASVKTGLWAMVVVSVRILALCTAPQILGNARWRNLGRATDLPFRHITQVALHSVVVVVALLLTGRGALLAVHCLIDLSHDLFLRRWEQATTVGAWLVVGYFVPGVALLIRLRRR